MKTTEQIMELAEDYADFAADHAHECSTPNELALLLNGRAALQAAVEQLVQERDEALRSAELIGSFCDKLRVNTSAEARGYSQQIRELEQERDALKAARMSYAAQFESLDADGAPDVGVIHQNIRSTKAEVKTLRDALEGVLPWVITKEVACNGLKCREPICMSCNSDSEEAAERASIAYQVARAALGETKS